jgi:hypothetical protein
MRTLATIIFFIAVVFGSDEDTAVLEKVDSRSIHSKYALDIVRQTEFAMEPAEVNSLFKRLSYSIVPAPDPSDDHPMLFFVKSPYTVMSKGSMHTPTLSVVIRKDTLSVSYRGEDLGARDDAFVTFCNDWNYKHMMSTCYVDDEGFVNLHNDIQLVGNADYATVNPTLVEQGMKYFRHSLTAFAKKLVNEVLKTDL